MTINFDRYVCCDLEKTLSREWIVTNGLGGYAAGTVAGVLTRAQHGLLVAMPPQAVKPQLLLAKIDEEVYFDQRTYYLGTNEYRDGTFNPSGFVHLESFRLEDGFPVFTYHLSSLDGLVLEKRIWMAQGHNTTFIQYRALRTIPIDKTTHTKSHASETLDTHTNRITLPLENGENHPKLTLTLLPLVTSRPFDTLQHKNNECSFQVHAFPTSEADTHDAFDASIQQKILSGVFAGCTLQACKDAPPYHILAVSQQESQTTFIPTSVWYWNFLHRCNKIAGLPSTDDLYLPGVIRAILSPDDDTILTLIVSTEELIPHMYQPETILLLYRESVEQQQSLLRRALQPPRLHYGRDKTKATAQIHPLRSLSFPDHTDGQQYLLQLIDAGNKFLAHYSKPTVYQRANKLSPGSETPGLFFEQQERNPMMLSDYYTLGKRTRDALIALPGLTLVTGRYDEALYILRDIAGYFIGGSLPDRLPDANGGLLDGNYQNVDIALWYFYALDHYLQVTHNYTFLEEIFPRLKECINRYIQGTRNGIRLDTTDGLLIATKPGRALTWMNAYVDSQPVTQRAGKPVEVNALWYHALSLMYEWSQQLNNTGQSGPNAEYYYAFLTQCKDSFRSRFWNAEQGYLYDVIDGPTGNDPALRVNQIFSLSLRHPLLDARYHKRVMKVITQHLLTPYGLRTLAPNNAGYQGHFINHRENLNALQLACHQGCAWPWLVGPYMDSLMLLYGEHSLDHNAHRSQEYLWHEGIQLLTPFSEHFQDGILGMCEAFFEGDSPHHPASLTASALSTAELLRTYHQLSQLNISSPEQAFTY